MNDKEHIESFIRKSLDQLEVQPSIPAFELTMKKLEAAQKEKRKRRFFIWFFAGIAGLGITSLALFYPSGETSDRLQLNAMDKKQQPIHALAQNNIDSHRQSPAAASAVTEVKKLDETTAKKADYLVSTTVVTSAHTNKPPAYTTPAPEAVVAAEPMVIQTMNGSETAWSFMRMNKAKFNTLYSEDTILRNTALMQKKTSAEDSVDTKKNIVWYVGIGFTPQRTLYSLHSEKNMDDKYISVSENYRTARLNEAKAVWSYQTALKSGCVYKEKWMLLFGLGYQVFTYKETISYITMDSIPGSTQPPPATTFTTTLGPTSGPSPANNPFNANGDFESITFKNTFRYAQLSASGSRLFRLRYFDLNAGLGFSVSRLLPSNVLTVEDKNTYTYRYRSNGRPMSAWTCTSGAHFGMMKQIGSRILLQAGPNAFYNLSPMFRKGYIIDQKPYGLGFDLNLLIRLN